MTTPIVVSALSEPIPAPLKKKRILLVDGSSTRRDLRAESMRKLGIDVDCASDIVEARSWWRADLYNLVLINVANGSGHRDKFCEDMRSANPPQHLAFLVGKPAYLADSPNAEEASEDQPESDVIPQKETGSPRSADTPGGSSQRWGILEASQRISAVRSASHARSKAVQAKPELPRDAEMWLAKRSRGSRTLDDLLREEMQ
jgi:CheY-like chemotaxis protein